MVLGFSGQGPEASKEKRAENCGKYFFRVRLKHDRRKKEPAVEHLQWNSNPCCSLERAMS